MKHENSNTLETINPSKYGITFTFFNYFMQDYLLEKSVMLMPKLLVFYYSSSGNTEKMAQAVAEGAKSIENIDVQLAYQINLDELNEFYAIIIGTPTYRKQMPIAIKTFLEEVSTKGISLKGKIGAVFGSYGWSGEAPQSVLDILKNKYEMHVIEPPIMAKYSPDPNTLKACKDLGQKIAKMLLQ